MKTHIPSLDITVEEKIRDDGVREIHLILSAPSSQYLLADALSERGAVESLPSHLVASLSSAVTLYFTRLNAAVRETAKTLGSSTKGQRTKRRVKKLAP